VASLAGGVRHVWRSRRRRVSPLLFSRHSAESVCEHGPRAACAYTKHRRRCGTTVASACTGEVSPFHLSLPVFPLPVNSLASRLGSQASPVGEGSTRTEQSPVAFRICPGNVSVPEPSLLEPPFARSHLSRGRGTFLVGHGSRSSSTFKDTTRRCIRLSERSENKTSVSANTVWASTNRFCYIMHVIPELIAERIYP
jgi:hypothetical protein